MPRRKANCELTPLWTEIERIVKEPNFDLQGEKLSPDHDYLLYRKIINFLYRGAAGTLFEIKEALGERALTAFLNYVTFFIGEAEQPGHYYPSSLVKKQIRQLKQVSDLIDLTETLNVISKSEYIKHGSKGEKGWKSDESKRQKKSTE